MGSSRRKPTVKTLTLRQCQAQAEKIFNHATCIVYSKHLNNWLNSGDYVKCDLTYNKWLNCRKGFKNNTQFKSLRNKLCEYLKECNIFCNDPTISKASSQTAFKKICHALVNCMKVNSKTFALTCTIKQELFNVCWKHSNPVAYRNNHYVYGYNQHSNKSAPKRTGRKVSGANVSRLKGNTANVNRRSSVSSVSYKRKRA